MKIRHRTAAVLLTASVLLLTACATGAGGDATPPADTVGLGDAWPSPPDGEVVAQGTVMDAGGTVELCLGAIAESYPPQCSGIPLEGWSWDGLEGSETASGVTWGAYAVQGTYDGETFTITQPPIMLALYDPMMSPDPTDGKPGQGSEDELAAIQDDLPDLLGEELLGSSVQDGWLWIDVVWDDGVLADTADAVYGPDVVVVRSALRPVDR
ncbi:hypothetical protein GCM10009775_01500 [Microbacterium aoyamense]|uniref:Uncharacterized protein n=1 Tax=Microbacterium aoyamense TaxID=344166 RepID=A0ABP5AFH6_9MICO|nr:hypothetical protein [Microbacterium aoyamense]